MKQLDSHDNKRKIDFLDGMFIFILGIPAIFILYLFWADQIKGEITVTFEMWLSLLAGYLTYYGTIVLAMVTVMQNRTISEISKKQMLLQEKSLNESNRPYFRIFGYYLHMQLGKNAPYCGAFNPIPEEQRRHYGCSIYEAYHIKTNRELSEWLDNTETDNPGIVPFKLAICNVSNSTIYELRFNSYDYSHDGGEGKTIFSCKKIIEILEPGCDEILEGCIDTNAKMGEWYSFDISFKNSFEKAFHERISVFLLTDKNTNKLILDIDHRRSNALNTKVYESNQKEEEPLRIYEN